ncbi:hypothetical protein [Dactylosporangium sp. CA-233914]
MDAIAFWRETHDERLLILARRAAGRRPDISNLVLSGRILVVPPV